MIILQTDNLKKIYGSGENAVHALDGVSLTIEKGEFTAIVGTSGSGKSKKTAEQQAAQTALLQFKNMEKRGKKEC